jgi:hypothetical protein
MNLSMEFIDKRRERGAGGGSGGAWIICSGILGTSFGIETGV